jgi:hypothetical protein
MCGRHCSPQTLKSRLSGEQLHFQSLLREQPLEKGLSKSGLIQYQVAGCLQNFVLKALGNYFVKEIKKTLEPRRVPESISVPRVDIGLITRSCPEMRPACVQTQQRRIGRVNSPSGTVISLARPHRSIESTLRTTATSKRRSKIKTKISGANARQGHQWSPIPKVN